MTHPHTQRMVGPGDVASTRIINGLRVKHYADGTLNALGFLGQCQRGFK